ncbi:uncharacterized protein E0L32_005382 [Thyridium curvatum]|uniref:Uncharacterized protein n=1 Tax=Thyridium curvatum TaxID=1093900 RepID=A0A507BC48_9PEZI|nr:uncharacterized protein E0L32_005382 [Thyridium curvatum]TPX14418.1 hypothetical protein E0L32_005382 [Thyridium curvatum]
MALKSVFLRALAILLLCLTLTCSITHATPSITTPNPLRANQEIQLTIDYKPDDALRTRFDSYRVFLALTPPGRGTGAACWLSGRQRLATTQVAVAIPADAAPDRSQVRISTGLFAKGGAAARTSGYSYGPGATLVGANGTWSRRELDGWTVGDAEEMPCRALGCARGCYERYYTGDRSRYSADDASEKEADDCAD